MPEDSPEVLILASKYDLTCDYVVSQLRRMEVKYVRLNSEDLSESKVEIDPVQASFFLEQAGHQYHISDDRLRSILFRRPVFLRDIGNEQLSGALRLSRAHWSTFMRSLMVFENPRWFNHPVSTYRAEHKALQLRVAARLGFAVPLTRVTNFPHRGQFPNEIRELVVKGLDPVLFKEGETEYFGFSTFTRSDTLDPFEWVSVPATVQQAITPKLDIRVTVVEKRVFAVGVTIESRGISGDWRRESKEAAFVKHDLPDDIAARCADLLEHFGLRFGAIDLALCDDDYYFLEINPTGEWAWLVDSADLAIDKALAEALSFRIERDD